MPKIEKSLVKMGPTGRRPRFDIPCFDLKCLETIILTLPERKFMCTQKFWMITVISVTYIKHQYRRRFSQPTTNNQPINFVYRITLNLESKNCYIGIDLRHPKHLKS